MYQFHCETEHQKKLITALFKPDLTVDMVRGLDKREALNVEINKCRWKARLKKHEPQLTDLNMISNLTPKEEIRLNNFLREELEGFPKIPGWTKLTEHLIKLKKHTSIKQWIIPVTQKIIDEDDFKMLMDGVIKKSNSSWSSPVILIRKATGKYRFCVNYCKVNDFLETDA